MARNIDPVCKMCRREQMKLYLKGERCFSPKCPIDKEHPPPGMHGLRRGKQSEYGLRLREKQKLKRFYGVFAAQFRRYYQLATRSVGNTGEQLLSILERRLDHVVHRLGVASSRATARQMVAHGHRAEPEAGPRRASEEPGPRAGLPRGGEQSGSARGPHDAAADTGRRGRT